MAETSTMPALKLQAVLHKVGRLGCLIIRKSSLAASSAFQQVLVTTCTCLFLAPTCALLVAVTGVQSFSDLLASLEL